ncbi:MAG: hypothetical protein G01um101438_760 [Parcubacteria group bacterium Gr01-1014_38]|nr:MAG: hypothetical protein G01um101438_760 [Parcubacteria group bacterium Gr01-1014_38]
MLPVRIVTRHSENPLLTPENVRPSQPDFEVHGVFNAGAARVGKKTVLVLRISERPKSRAKDIIRIPALTFVKNRPKLSFTDLSLKDPRYDFSEFSVVWTTKPPRVIRYLTSLSHLRLAWSEDGVRFRIESHPWLFPHTREEAWGCEDARVTQIGKTYRVNYTAVSDLGIATALASTRTFQEPKRHGVIIAPANRDVTIFPEKISGKYAAHHRPMPAYIGGTNIWYASSPDFLHWGDHRFVAGPRPGLWDGEKIGGGAPPIRTPKGWLSIYHGVDRKNRYSLGALLTDLKQPWKILARSRRPLLAPTAPYERRGFVSNVCFTCGAVERNGDLWIYYGAADRVIALANAPIRDIVQSLTKS